VRPDFAVTFDVVCAGAVYLDLTFDGLDGLPSPGEERWARELQVSPGGMANTAIGLARLGMRTAVAWPLGRDVTGAYLRAALEREGVTCAGPSAERSSITAVMPFQGDRAMVSFEPPDTGRADVIRELAPRAVVALVDQIHLCPPGALAYATTSHAHARTVEPSTLPAVHALIANQQEAIGLSGAADARSAACWLAQRATTAVVTLGAHGALAVSGQSVEHVRAPRGEVRDVTGAGDLFAAAYVWADLHGLGLRERLMWATLYATLSLKTVTAFAGAAGVAELYAAGRELGLVPPACQS
jgi:sugar/nucleoside kinase (ribokinase family)